MINFLYRFFDGETVDNFREAVATVTFVPIVIMLNEPALGLVWVFLAVVVGTYFSSWSVFFLTLVVTYLFAGLLVHYALVYSEGGLFK